MSIWCCYGYLLLFILEEKKTPTSVSHCVLSIFSASSGGIATDLQDKRKKFQNKRKSQVTDSAQLKDFPCKRFKQVSVGCSGHKWIKQLSGTYMCRGRLVIKKKKKIERSETRLVNFFSFCFSGNMYTRRRLSLLSQVRADNWREDGVNLQICFFNYIFFWTFKWSMQPDHGEDSRLQLFPEVNDCYILF